MKPYLILFDRIGNRAAGFLTTTQYAEKLPFPVRRVFWTYGIPGGVARGNHANKQTEEVLVAVSGSIEIEAEWAGGKETFTLSSPTSGLYIPALCWTTLHFSEAAVAVCLASTDFSEDDYIRDYAAFLENINPKN